MRSFIGLVRIFRIFKIFRIYNLKKESSDESFALREYWEIRRKGYVILSSLIITLLVCAGLI